MALAIMQLFYLYSRHCPTPAGWRWQSSRFLFIPSYFCSFPAILATNIMTAKHFFSRKSYFYIKVCIFAYTKKQKG